MMKTSAFLFSLAFALAGSLACFAATGSKVAVANPATGTPDGFFGITNLYAFHLTIAPDQWAIMEQPDDIQAHAPRPENNNDESRGFRPAPATGRDRNGPGPTRNGPTPGAEFQKGTATLEFQGQPWGALRVRFKGHSSFRFAGHSLKRSLKLDFNDLEKGRTFFGLTKLNLNNNAMDPSQLREALAYHIFRSAGVPAGRTAFAKVFITVPGQCERAYAGLYTIVEQVDERFLKARFGSKHGMLLKPEQLVGLPYLGDAWAAYTNRVQAKTAFTTNDASRFIEFVRCLNSADAAHFQAAMAEYVDLDEFLRFLAVQALLSNLDSPLRSGHNYYLYLHPQTRKFLWLPWDLNEAFGAFGPGGSASLQVDLSLDQPFTSENRLAARVLQAPGMKQRYHTILRGLLAADFNPERLFPVMHAMAATIRSAVAGDPMVSLPQFEAALADWSQPGTRAADLAERSAPRRGGPDGPGAGPGPRLPLQAFITQRVASARLQLEGKTTGYVPREMPQEPRGEGPGGRGRADLIPRTW